MSFRERGGHWVFSSMFLSKLFNFILSIVIVRLLAEKIYGDISYAFSIMQILLPLAGFGLHHSLLRFGAIEQNDKAKSELFIRLIKRGTLYSILLIIVLIILSPFITQKLPGSTHYLQLFSPLLLTVFLSELLLSFYRIRKNNRLYAVGLSLKSIFMFIICSLATYFYNGTGYVIAYITVPLVLFFALIPVTVKKYHIPLKIKIKDRLSPYVKYGLWVGMGSIASQLVILIDMIMVANIIADSVQVAIYKVATIIPLNLLFLPMVLLKTDYVYIAENYQNKQFIYRYYKKYLSIFILVLAIILTSWFLFSDKIMLLFGSEYSMSEPIINILMLMLAGAFLLRVPLGNILNALGKSSWNSVSNLILLGMNIVLNLIFIPRFGLLGAAYASVISVWTSGLINIGLYVYYIRNYAK